MNGVPDKWNASFRHEIYEIDIYIVNIERVKYGVCKKEKVEK